ncbi:MAG: YkgJ family cysteine cluster protein [Gemmatimonadota bacterium]
MTTGDSVVAAYRELLEQLDRWFQATRNRHPGVIPCRSGCTACCHGPFDISSADVLLVRAGVKSLPLDRQRDVRHRAERQVAMMQEAEPGWDGEFAITDIGDERFDAVAERMKGEPCPCLDDDGACMIYQDRPLVCRTMGLPMDAANHRIIENACPIQEQFPGYAALAPRFFDLESLESAEAGCLEAAAVELFGTPLRSDFETTIAGAITRMADG